MIKPWTRHNYKRIVGPAYIQILVVSSVDVSDGHLYLLAINRQTVILHSQMPVDELLAVLKKLRYTKTQQFISKWDCASHVWASEHDGKFLTVIEASGYYHACDSDKLFEFKQVPPVPQPAESDPQSEETSEIPTETIDPDADDQTETPLLSLAEAAELLGVSQRTIRRRCETGVIQGELGTDARLYVRIAAAPVE